MKSVYFFRDKPIFGLDITSSAIHVMQAEQRDNSIHIVGYGRTELDSRYTNNGIITEPQKVAAFGTELLRSYTHGEINTDRVVLSVPAAKTFSRAIVIPKLNKTETLDAVRLEAEQYIPIPFDELYIDYTVLHDLGDKVEILLVASPKTLIDSYYSTAKLMGLEVVAIETNTDAAARLFHATDTIGSPSVLVIFGSNSVDITIVDKNVVATGTIDGGDENITKLISSQLGVSPEEADAIKTNFGLNVSKKQSQINAAVSPHIEQLCKEIKRMVRYYEQRYQNERKINQIVLMGSGAMIPGLSDRMTAELRLPVRTSDPWKSLNFGKLQRIDTTERPGYITACGLANINPREIFT